MESEQDPLFSILRAEAMAHRPEFSSELHAKTVGGLPSRPKWGHRLIAFRPAAIAAAILICTFAGLRVLVRKHPPIELTIKLQPVNVMQPPSVLAFNLPSHKYRIKGIVSASLWPPEILLELPIPISASELSDQHSAVASASAGLPQFLLDAMKHEVTATSDALSDQLPPELRILKWKKRVGLDFSQ